jgi:hypothetical protein
MPQANAQDRDRLPQFQDEVIRNTAIIRVAGAGTDDNFLRSERSNFIQCYLVVPKDLEFGPQFSQVLHQVIGKGIIIIYHNYHLSILI